MASYKKVGSKWKATISWRLSDGKLKQKSKNGFDTKVAAKDWATELEYQLKHGANMEREITFPAYFDEWFKLYKESKITATTASRYKMIARELHRHFERVDIKKMDRRKYQKFINEYGQGHAPDTVKKLNSIVRSCVKSAVFDDLISKDFTQNVTLTWNEDRVRKVEYLNLAEIKQLLDCAKSNLNPHFTSRYMIVTAIYTGMRIGEIAALTWKDINFNWKTITINKAWDEHTRKFKKAKTESSNRIIRVNDDLLNCLGQLKDNNTEMVFKNQYGTIPTSGASNKTLRQLLAECQINRRGFHFHSLRHSHVAYLLSQGVDLYAISKRLGHSDMTTTSKKYAYLIDEYKAKSDDHIEELLENLGNKKSSSNLAE
ncbi:integrase [Ligilactobacillus salitolerans]|uniref:Integrase n=1 Tax=Ligilactobacillus salitolerans TaxID=1808352 RepID=A0A401IUR4_9LACO|nr:site-specific integrase [Ligilactobacillus salitolerans]GBG95227.1 integrase [Ligilactobacillus salitolerans]